jgi:hypothetical protein
MRGPLAVIGALFVILIVIGVIASQNESNDGTTFAGGTPFTNTVDASGPDLSGLWIDEEGDEYRFERRGMQWIVSLENTVTGEMGFSAEGRWIGAQLVFSFHENVAGSIVFGTGELGLSADGRTMQGLIHAPALNVSMPLVLHRGS